MTSSAVVGSSAIRMSGFSASAMAIMMRWRWPPENWCGYLSSAASRLGDADARAAARARARAASARGHAVDAHDLGDLPADGVDRVEVASGSWKIIAMRLPLMSGARSSAGIVSRSWPSKRISPAVISPGGQSIRSMIAEADDPLAGAALAEDREGLAAVEMPDDVARPRGRCPARCGSRPRGRGPRAGGQPSSLPPLAISSRQRCAGSVAIRSQLDRRLSDSVVEHDREARPEGEPPGAGQIVAALRDHQAPGDLGRLDADAEEGQRRSRPASRRRSRASRW